MTSVASVDSTTAGANQGSAALDAQAELAAAGLPPTNLARAATTNTVNAALVSSQWGVDPSTVAGVYGGVGASGGLFASDNLLPLLTNLSRANAEQALSLLGIKTPSPGNSTTSYAPTSSATAASNAQSQSALAQAYGGTATGTVDPLWGKSA
jgi:hypothetical protein